MRLLFLAAEKLKALKEKKSKRKEKKIPNFITIKNP